MTIHLSGRMIMAKQSKFAVISTGSDSDNEIHWYQSESEAEGAAHQMVKEGASTAFVFELKSISRRSVQIEKIS
jgi:hypothetical protein